MPLPLVLDVLRPSARGETRALGASALFGAAGVLLELARPWPLAFAIDYAIGGRDLGGLSAPVLLGLAGVAVVVLSAASGLAEMAGVVAAERAAERVGARLRQDAFDRSISLSLRWHDRMRSGELVSRLTTDIGRLLDALVAFCSTLGPDAMRLVLVLVVLCVLEPVLALVAMAVVPILLVLAVRQRRLVRSAQTEARASSGRFTGAVVDLVRNVRAVQAFGRTSQASATFAGHSRVLLDANLRAVTTEARWAPIADVVLACGSGIALVIGGGRVVSGQLSTGDLLVVLTYVSALYSPIRGLSRLSGVFAKASVSAGRLREVLQCGDRVLDRPAARPAPAITDSVRFRSVRFGYTSGRPVLDGFDLSVRAGETVCLLGRSGAGKSTVLNLLLRLYDVDAGAVLLDGVDVRDIDQQSLRRAIAFVPQDPWLFDASVAENIAFGSPAATRHGVMAAGRTALVDEFVHDLPFGYDSRIGEGAALLSGGQRRRVALARAVVSDAPLVLLDEPTASLDAQSAAAVTDAIRRTTVGRTVLIVTHDPDLASIADRVVVIDRPRPHTSPAVPVGESVAVREEVTT